MHLGTWDEAEVLHHRLEEFLPQLRCISGAVQGFQQLPSLVACPRLGVHLWLLDVEVPDAVGIQESSGHVQAYKSPSLVAMHGR